MTYAYFNRQQLGFGPAGADAQRAYEEHLARWLANGRSLPDDDRNADAQETSSMTVADIVARYLEHAEREYGARELKQFAQAFRTMLALFRGLPGARRPLEQPTQRCLTATRPNTSEGTEANRRSRVGANRACACQAFADARGCHPGPLAYGSPTRRNPVDDCSSARPHRQALAL